LLILGIEVTCLPSPCGRLSRPRTTMETPLPWGSPPEGQSRAPLIHHVLARFRSSTHPYPRTRCPMSHSRATAGLLRHPTIECHHVIQRSRQGRPEPSRDGHDYRRSPGVTLWRVMMVTNRDWTSSSLALTIPRGPCRASLPLAACSSAFPAGFVPLGLVGCR